MVMMNERRSLGVLLLLAGSAACKEDSPTSSEPDTGDDVMRIAGQTGDEGARPWAPSGGSSDSDSPCPLSDTTEALASLDENTPLGFSAADVLVVAAGSHDARVNWNARPVVSNFLDYAVQVMPGDLSETLRLVLTHEGSSPRYRARHLLFDGGTRDYCRGQLELGVTVELRSQSGALDERWWGTLKASDVSEVVVLLQAPTWRGRLPRQPDRDEGNFVNAQEGNLNVLDANDPGSVLAWVDVVLRFRTGAIDGSVNGWVQTAAGGAFVLPQLSDGRDAAGWIGVIGDGFYDNIWAIE
jgi:hypothetical protein